MQELDKYKNGLKSYRNGFGLGLLLGVVLCLFIGKVIWAFPVVFALVLGAVFFESKLNKNG